MEPEKAFYALTSLAFLAMLWWLLWAFVDLRREHKELKKKNWWPNLHEKGN